MSQCLDGRLPSGRRAAVMQHLQSCGECSVLWRELQQAQEMILRLPVRKVSADFHDKLWARIKAGEGTPEAVFRDPMPLAAKVRYALTGAAAAALLLAVLNIWDVIGSQPRNPVGIAPPVDFAETAMPGLTPLAPPAFAQEAANVVARSYRQLTDNYRKLESQSQETLDESTVRVIAESARGVKSVGGLLLWMQQSQHLDLPRDLEVSLRLAESSLDVNQLQASRDRASLTMSLRPVLGQLSGLNRLPHQMMVRMQYGPEEQRDFLRWVQERIREQRELLEYLPVEVLRQNSPFVGVRIQRLQEDEIQLFLARRRR